MNKLALVPGGVDAVILDIGLPDRSGEALSREIRAIHPSLPIVLATGHGASTLREAFTGEIAIGFVQKPYAAQDLLRALRALGICTPQKK
jgi:FixJ family two-component response regulator